MLRAIPWGDQCHSCGHSRFFVKMLRRCLMDWIARCKIDAITPLSLKMCLKEQIQIPGMELQFLNVHKIIINNNNN